MKIKTEYQPKKVINSCKSAISQGIIAKVRFIRRIYYIIPQYKDIYYWLPYKKLLSEVTKYGHIGPSRRDPYAALWLEVKTDSEIYKQGLNDFIFRQKKLYAAGPAIRFGAFTPKEVHILTRKKVIKFLDEHFKFIIATDNKHYNNNLLIKEKKSSI